MTLATLILDDNIIKNIYQNLDELLELIPELKPMINFNQQHPHHHLDAFNHTLLALSLSPKDFTIRLALLLHDIGKPFVYTEENGIRHYPNHGKYSSILARRILTRLNYPTKYIDIISDLIAKHDEEITEEDIRNNYDFSFLLCQIQYCDALAHHPLKLDKRIKYLNKIAILLNTPNLTR